MQINAVTFLRILHVEQSGVVLGIDGTFVAYLAATLTVKRCTIQNYRTGSLTDHIGRFVIYKNCQYFRGRTIIGVSGKDGFRQIM